MMDELFPPSFKWTDEWYISYVKTNGEGKLYPNTLINCFKKMGYIDESCSGILDVVNSSLTEIKQANIIFNNLTPKVTAYNVLSYLQNWDVYNIFPQYRMIVSSVVDALGDNQICDIIKERNNKNYPLLSDVKFFKNNSTSVSQIECFNSCPYKHFLKYGIRLRDSKDYKLKPLLMVTILLRGLLVMKIKKSLLT